MFMRKNAEKICHIHHAQNRTEGKAPPVLFLLYIQFRRDVQFVRDILPVFLALAHTFGQKILYLSVHRTKVILGPCRDRLIQLCREPQRDLFFLVIRHISKDCPS